MAFQVKFLAFHVQILQYFGFLMSKIVKICFFFLQLLTVNVNFLTGDGVGTQEPQSAGLLGDGRGKWIVSLLVPAAQSSDLRRSSVHLRPPSQKQSAERPSGRPAETSQRRRLQRSKVQLIF